MELSRRTIDILKNFSTINQSIVVFPGNVLKTMSIARNILAEAIVEEEFPIEFAIYNVPEFISIVSLFDNPYLEFEEKWVKIREKDLEREGVKYYYSNKELIVHPTKNIKIPDSCVEFSIPESSLVKISRASSILGLSDVAIIGNEHGIDMIALDRKNESSSNFETKVSTTPQSTPFKYYFKQENLRFLPGDYTVQVSEKGICLFKRSDGMIQYAIALETV